MLIGFRDICNVLDTFRYSITCILSDYELQAGNDWNQIFLPTTTWNRLIWILNVLTWNLFFRFSDCLYLLMNSDTLEDFENSFSVKEFELRLWQKRLISAKIELNVKTSITPRKIATTRNKRILSEVPSETSYPNHVFSLSKRMTSNTENQILSIYIRIKLQNFQ